MGRIRWFLAGSAVGSFQILNYVYENELLKQQLMKEIMIVYRMKGFSVHQVIDFKKRSETSQVMAEQDMQFGLENMNAFYHNLSYSVANALREKVLNNIIQVEEEEEEDITTINRKQQL